MSWPCPGLSNKNYIQNDGVIAGKLPNNGPKPAQNLLKTCSTPAQHLPYITGFRAGFRAEAYRENLKIGPPEGPISGFPG